MKAKTKQEFESVWNTHISQVSYLTESLPSTKALEVLDLVKKLKEYIQIAANHVYGDKK